MEFLYSITFVRWLIPLLCTLRKFGVSFPMAVGGESGY